LASTVANSICHMTYFRLKKGSQLMNASNWEEYGCTNFETLDVFKFKLFYFCVMVSIVASIRLYIE